MIAENIANRKKHFLFVLILCLALFVRFFVLFSYLSTHHGRPETWEYEQIARNLLDGKGYVYLDEGTESHSFGFPFFPFVCFLLHLLGGRDNFVPYFLFQGMLSLGILWLIFRFAKRLFGLRTAFLTALLVALEPALILYGSYKVHEMTLATFLTLALLELFAILQEKWKLRYAIALGIISGIGILTRPTTVAVFPMLVAWAVTSRGARRRVWAQVFTVFAFVVLTLLPWTIRNYLVYHRFIFFSVNSSEVFWRGNNPASSGSNLTLKGKPVLDVAPEKFKKDIQTSDETGRHLLFEREAFRYVMEQPLEFVWRTATKFWYFWWFSPTYGMMYGNLSIVVKRAYQLLYGGLLLVAGFGSVTALRTLKDSRRLTVVSLFAFGLSVAFIHALVYVEGRHKLTLMPFILMFSAYGMELLYQRLTLRKEVYSYG